MTEIETKFLFEKLQEIHAQQDVILHLLKKSSELTPEQIDAMVEDRMGFHGWDQENFERQDE